VDEILPGLQELWAGRLYVVRSQPEYIEFTDISVSKSGALAWLCERLGVPRDGVVALGDGMNDVDMLEWAGLGVAVAEAARPVRDAADAVVPRADVPAFLRALSGPADSV
jgi:hydroxymethylpyrimidine pyrophosphatase-like HAD family hydrolase